MLTDARAPFLGTPLVPLQRARLGAASCRGAPFAVQGLRPARTELGLGSRIPEVLDFRHLRKSGGCIWGKKQMATYGRPRRRTRRPTSIIRSLLNQAQRMRNASFAPSCRCILAPLPSTCFATCLLPEDLVIVLQILLRPEQAYRFEP